VLDIIQTTPLSGLFIIIISNLGFVSEEVNTGPDSGVRGKPLKVTK